MNDAASVSLFLSAWVPMERFFGLFISKVNVLRITIPKWALDKTTVMFMKIDC